MADLFTLANLGTLGMLVLLQAVLGLDNLLYISLESKRAPLEKQNYVRKVGIGIAIILRIALLFLLVNLIEKINVALFSIDTNFIHGNFDVHSLIVLLGGGFIIYTATKEIWHMIAKQDLTETAESNGNSKKTSAAVITSIVLMNLVFSFDSILAAIGLTSDIENSTTAFIVMAIAIVLSGIIMLVLADKVSAFLAKNRMYEVLGLFVLLVVGIMLISEGGHLAHLDFFDYKVEKMSKATFYFVIAILIIVDLVQGRYQKKLLAEQELKNGKS